MGLNGLFEKVSDPYERQARLWPALLAILPLLALLGVVYAPLTSLLTTVAMLAGSCGVLYLFTNIAREQGKRLEPSLFESWGGKPTTQLLRHRDKTIEVVTKRRYHDFLSRMIHEPFPESKVEADDPLHADEVYQSGVRWLLNQTRDTATFALLFKENVAYGFRRNGLGLRPLGLTVSICSALWTLFMSRVLNLTWGEIFDDRAISNMTEPEIVVLAVSLSMTAVWLFFFTRGNVQRSAFTYAETLLRSCDILDKPEHAP